MNTFDQESFYLEWYNEGSEKLTKLKEELDESDKRIAVLENKKKALHYFFTDGEFKTEIAEMEAELENLKKERTIKNSVVDKYHA